MIANLIDNARAYGGGAPEVSIRVVDCDDEPMSHILIAVEDHGPGVPEDERDAILGANAAEFYGFDVEKLAPIVARVGPEKRIFEA